MGNFIVQIKNANIEREFVNCAWCDAFTMFHEFIAMEKYDSIIIFKICKRRKTRVRIYQNGIIVK